MNYQAKATQIWEQMNKNQRAGVRFGLFPAEVMQSAEGYNRKDLCVALMEIAKKKGGMIAYLSILRFSFLNR